jgi:hypothetical protein
MCSRNDLCLDRRAKSRSARRMPAQGSGNEPPEEVLQKQFGEERW